MIKESGIIIDGVRMRLTNDLDFKLYQDITTPASDWANEHLTPEMIVEGPPPELRRLINEAKRKIDHFGFVYTPMGLLIRDDLDILDTGSDQDAAEAEQLCQQALQRMRK